MSYSLAKDTINRSDIRALIGWLEQDPWLTQGKLVRQFEQEWAVWEGSRYAVFCNSGSSANLLMYYAALLGGDLKNKKVIVPAVSWATTVAPAIQLGFEPILCEADQETFGLDLEHLKRLIEEHDPAMVVCVHVLGAPNRMEELMALKASHGFVLLEDSCAATGSTYDGKKVGTFGEMSSFSFFFGHHLSTIEGGMVCTDSEEIYHLLLQLRSHGWAKDLPADVEESMANQREVEPFNRRFTFYIPGFNLRSTDLNAFIGLRQLERADEVVACRVSNHRIYQQRFGQMGLACQINPRAEISSISFVSLADSPAHRDRLAQALTSADIETRPLGGGNMSRQPFWSDRYGVQELSFADRIHYMGFHLPNHQGLLASDIHQICDVVEGVKR